MVQLVPLLLDSVADVVDDVCFVGRKRNGTFTQQKNPAPKNVKNRALDVALPHSWVPDDSQQHAA